MCDASYDPEAYGVHSADPAHRESVEDLFSAAVEDGIITREDEACAKCGERIGAAANTCADPDCPEWGASTTTTAKRSSLEVELDSLRGRVAVLEAALRTVLGEVVAALAASEPDGNDPGWQEWNDRKNAALAFVRNPVEAA